MNSWITEIRDLIWGPPLLLFILGTGLYLTVRLRGLQFRYLPEALRLVFRRPSTKGRGEISQFQALMTALAATIGIGNIAGVAIALTVGGPGALLWMVIAALVGMATIYCEAFLAIRFRVSKDGAMAGGPMYTLSQGKGWKSLAGLFAVGGVFAALTTGNMVQANSIADVVQSYLPVSRWWIGTGCAGIVGLVLIGGIRNIGRVAGVLVPAMAALYLLGALAILIMRWDQLPAALTAIVTAAFSGKAAMGGAAGASILVALRMGVARGLLASEAGLGSAPIAAAAARTESAGRQALISMTGAFISVCIVCTLTGLVLAVTGVIETTELTGVPLTVAAFDSTLASGHWIVVIGALLFGYSTMLGWAYYGEKCLEYLVNKRAVPIYRLIFICVVALGAALDLNLVWSLADLSNALMVVPNLLGLWALAGLVSKETKPYLRLIRADLTTA